MVKNCTQVEAENVIKIRNDIQNLGLKTKI